MIITLATSLLVASIQNPTLVTPGDPALKPVCDSHSATALELVVVAPSGSERVVARLQRSKSRSTELGQPVCIIVQRYLRDSSTDVDSSIVNAATLAPVRYSARVNSSVERFWFRGDSAGGAVVEGDSARRVYAERSPDPFFLAVADLSVLAALPLAPGYEARFASYNPGRGFHDVQIRVEGLDTLVTLGTPTPAWRVSYDAGAAPTVLWLDAADHELIRSRSTLRNGAIFWRRRMGDGG